MMKFMLQSLLVLGLIIGSVCADEQVAPAAGVNAASAWDAQAKGLKEVTKNNLAAAKDWFVKSAKIAIENNDWQATVAAGSSLSTVGEPDQAAQQFKLAEAITKKISDWEPSLVVGYAYASLPKAVGKLKEAAILMAEAEQKAEEQQDWQGLIEVSRGFAAINEQLKANSTLNKAEAIINELKKPEAYAALAKTFSAYGELQKAREYEEKAIEHTPEQELAQVQAEAQAPKRKVRHKGSPPPPGWSPVGESLAKPKKIDPQAAAMLHDRAQIKLDAAEERILFDKYEKSYEKMNTYQAYYFDDLDRYQYRVWDRQHQFDVNLWAEKMLQSGFTLSDGVFIRRY